MVLLYLLLGFFVGSAVTSGIFLWVDYKHTKTNGG